jgi:hypothetical protein
VIRPPTKPSGIQAQSHAFARQNVRSAGARTTLSIGVNLDCIDIINVLDYSFFLKGV